MSEVATLDAALLGGFPLPRHRDGDNKDDRGRLLVIGGSRELAGAALLAGIAGLRAGAGKLQIATADSITAALGVAVPEARVVGHAEGADGCIAVDAVAPLVELAREAGAVTIGCGLRHGPGLDALLAGLLDAAVPLVIDAAALDSLRGCGRRADDAIILPHAGEMARLLDREIEKVRADPLAAARAATDRFGTVSLIKGGDSHIVAPDGRAFRFHGGGVGLATSGSGDVLAGIVGGLRARGADPLTAALWGVYLHGEAGRTLSREVGPIGFLARELPDRIPGLLGSA